MKRIFNIGRDFDTPISIDDTHSSVSHDHATITIDGNRWILCDNNSTNGTFIEVNGEFVRCGRVEITPRTWIRLGEQGHRGFSFKARRILSPNDYREDFEELNELYEEYENLRSVLESKRRVAKFITPVLMCAGLLLSLLPSIRSNGMAVRASFMLPGFFSPFIQDAILNKYEKRVKDLQKDMICPKCRRTLSKDDIINRKHSYCQAH